MTHLVHPCPLLGIHDENWYIPSATVRTQASAPHQVVLPLLRSDCRSTVDPIQGHDERPGTMAKQKESVHFLRFDSLTDMSVLRDCLQGGSEAMYGIGTHVRMLETCSRRGDVYLSTLENR